LLILDESINYVEPIFDIDSKKWLKPMKSKMDFMYTNRVWTLVDPHKWIKLIGCEWIFKRKTDIENKVQMYKDRLAVKGYKQR
jgi:6-pyruvoyl-tetrahydropterin synthase